MGWDFPWAVVVRYRLQPRLSRDTRARPTPCTRLRGPPAAQPAGQAAKKGEREGAGGVFLRDGEDRLGIPHLLDLPARPRHPFLNTYNFLDLTPLGRREGDGIMRWLRHHDKY